MGIKIINGKKLNDHLKLFFHKKSKEKGYGKLSSDEDLEIIVDQKQVSERLHTFSTVAL